MEGKGAAAGACTGAATGEPCMHVDVQSILFNTKLVNPKLQ
jgi:hypothetical protein